MSYEDGDDGFQEEYQVVYPTCKGCKPTTLYCPACGNASRVEAITAIHPGCSVTIGCDECKAKWRIVFTYAENAEEEDS